jgi:glycerol-3-phosphate acyltransferase PlsY
MAVTGLLAALIGHSFSCFTHFKGGKGVATASGGLLALMPVVLVVSTLAWIIVFYASRYVSLASIVAAVLLPITATLTHRPPIFIGITVAVMVFVVIRHRANISRLMAGTESKFVKKKKPGEGDQQR